MALRSVLTLAGIAALLTLTPGARAQAPAPAAPPVVEAPAEAAQTPAATPDEAPVEKPADVPAGPSRLESEPEGWVDVTPGTDLAGWTRQAWPVTSKMGPQQWSADGGTLVCDGTGGHDWLRLDRELGDAVFHVEWRFLPPSDVPVTPADVPYNSGVLVRTAADQSVWHQAQVGGVTSGFLFGRTPVGGTVQRVNLAGHLTSFRVRAPGEWNTYEVTATGRTISLWVNGAVTSEMTVDVLRGHFGLEGEGHRIAFRNLKLKVL